MPHPYDAAQVAGGIGMINAAPRPQTCRVDGRASACTVWPSNGGATVSTSAGQDRRAEEGQELCPVCAGLDDWSQGTLCRRCEADIATGLAYEAEQAEAMMAARKRQPGAGG